MNGPTASGTGGKTPTQIAAEYLEQGHSLDEVLQRMKQEKVFFPSISGVLNEILGKKNMTVESMARLSGINPATIYRFMNNERNPSRNALLRIAITLELSLSETQVLLKSGNCAALSASRKRDLIIMDGIVNHKYLVDINDELLAQGLTDLSSRG